MQDALIVTDVLPGGETRDVEVGLPQHVRYLGQNSTDDGRWSASLKYFDVRCTLRERHNGAIQCKADWLPGSGVRSTGKKLKSEALVWAVAQLRAEHMARLEGGSLGVDPDPSAGDKGLRLSDACLILRNRKLLPGKEGSKQQAPYDLMLDIARTVWKEDPYLSHLNKNHVRSMYQARILPAYLDEAGLEDLSEEELEPFVWPGFIDRRPIGRVKPQTVQGDLVDLKTAFGKLIGETDSNGKKYLVANPLDGLDLGKFEKDKKDVAGVHRYPSVIRYANDAVERIRTEGHRYKETRSYNGGRKTYDRAERFPLIVPGMLRMMLVLQFGHPTRPKAIRHLQVSDIALDRAEMVRVINTLKFRKSDERIGMDVLEIWVHGAVAYRRKWSKNNTERLVPNSADIACELSEYLMKRSAWLRESRVESPWLFPSPRNPSEPISEKDAGHLLACGEELAREMVLSEGRNPAELVPAFHGTAWYAYRRFWKTNRNTMGWEANRNAAYVGDWTTKSGATADVVYARFSPHLILAVVEGKTIVEALKSDSGTAEAKRAARIRPDMDEVRDAERAA